MTPNTTLRLIVPDWQAGVNPTYALGARILAAIAPTNPRQVTETVPVPPTSQPLSPENGVVGQIVVKETVTATATAIQRHSPDRLITLGGNCMVSQAPIDYLNGRYPGKLGVIWLDAHPDISTPAVYNHEHAMVLGNLLHRGDPALATLVRHPLAPAQVYYAGLQAPTAEEQSLLAAAGVDWRGHDQLSIAAIKDWATTHCFTHLYLHFDIDVLNPRNFFSTYHNNPRMTTVPDNAAVGAATVPATWQLIRELDQLTGADLVGLTIAEYLPWDAQQLADLMGDLPLFLE